MEEIQSKKYEISHLKNDNAAKGEEYTRLYVKLTSIFLLKFLG